MVSTLREEAGSGASYVTVQIIVKGGRDGGKRDATCMAGKREDVHLHVV